MIRVRELSRTTIEVAGELHIAARGGLTYVDIIANDTADALAMIEGMIASTANVRYDVALKQIRNRLKTDDERVSLVDEDGDRIPG